MIYMPYPDFRRSAKCLSDQHLREQRVACRNVIQTLTVPRSAQLDAILRSTWEGHINAVLEVTDATLAEMARRKLKGPLGVTPWMLRRNDEEPPDWLGDEAWHLGVKRILLKADPAHYGRMMWRV